MKRVKMPDLQRLVAAARLLACCMLPATFQALRRMLDSARTYQKLLGLEAA